MKNLQGNQAHFMLKPKAFLWLLYGWKEGSTHERREWTSEEPDDNNWVLETIYV